MRLEKTQKVFLKSLETALELSQLCLQLIEEKKHEKALAVLDNRSRVVNIVLHLDETVRGAGHEVSEEFNNLVSRLITSINERDKIIYERLNQEKLLTQNEIAKTSKNKENFKGYNLNDLK